MFVSFIVCGWERKRERDSRGKKSGVPDQEVWWRTSFRARGRYWTPHWVVDQLPPQWCCTGLRCLDPGPSESAWQQTINPLVNEVCINVHTVFHWAMCLFIVSVLLSGGEETNSNTFTTVGLHLLGRWGVCYSHTVCDIQPCTLISLSFTQSLKLDIAYSTLKTRTHTRRSHFGIISSRYSRIPLELPQGELCILFGRMKYLQKTHLI